MGILAASNSFSSFVVQSQSCKLPYLRVHAMGTHSLKDQREVMKSVRGLGWQVLNFIYKIWGSKAGSKAIAKFPKLTGEKKKKVVSHSEWLICILNDRMTDWVPGTMTTRRSSTISCHDRNQPAVINHEVGFNVKSSILGPILLTSGFLGQGIPLTTFSFPKGKGWTGSLLWYVPALEICEIKGIGGCQTSTGC